MSSRIPEDKNSSFYRIRSFDEKSSKFNTRVVKVISSSSIPPGTIQKSLQALSSKFSEDHKDLKEKEITLEQSPQDLKTVNIQIKGRSDTESLQINIGSAESKPESQNIKVEKMDLSLAPAKTWATKFSHNVKELHPKGGAALGLVIFLETLLFPLTLIGYSLFSIGHLISTKVAESSRASQAEKELQKLLGPASFDQFLEGLRTIEKLENRLGKNPDFSRSLQSALLYGADIQKVAKGKRDVVQLRDKLETNLNSAKEDMPVILPCGSFVGKDFIPAMLLMHKTESGEIIVKKLSFSPSDDPFLEKTQVFTKYKLAKEALPSMLTRIVEAQQASKALSLEERKKMATAQKGLGLHPKVELPRDYRSAIDMFFSDFAEPIELTAAEEPWAFASPSSDPLSLLSLFVRKPFLELQGTISLLEKQIIEKNEKKEDPRQDEENLKKAKEDLQALAEKSPELADKGAVLHLYVAELTRRLCKYAHTLSDDVRAGLFLQLEQRISKLGKRWSKAYGDKIAEEFLQTVRSKIAREKGNVERSLAWRRIVQRDEVSNETERSHPTILIERQEALPTTQLPAAAVEIGSEQLEISYQGEPLAAVVEHTQEVRGTFSQKTYDKDKVNEALGELAALVDVADQLVASNNFSDARLYVQELLDVLPSAGNRDLLDKLSEKQMKALLSQAQKLQELRLELELRLGIFTLSPKELVGSVNASLLTTAYINRRANEIFQKCIAEIEKKIAQEPLSDLMKNLFCDSDGTPKNDEDLLASFFKTLASKNLNCHELMKMENKKLSSGDDPAKIKSIEDDIAKKKEILKEHYESLQLNTLTDEELTTLLLSVMPINTPIAKATELCEKLEQSPDVSTDLLNKQIAFQQVLKKQKDRYNKARLYASEEFSLSVHQSTAQITTSSFNDFLSFLMHFRPESFSLDSELSPSDGLNKKMKEIVQEMPERPLDKESSLSFLQHLQREELLTNCLLLPEACLHPPKDMMEDINPDRKILSKQSVLASLSQSPGRMTISHLSSNFLFLGSPPTTPVDLSCIKMGSKHLFFVPGKLTRDYSRSSFTEEEREACFDQRIKELTGVRDAPLAELEGKQEGQQIHRHNLETYYVWAREAPITNLPASIEAQLACLETAQPSSVILTMQFLFEHQELLSTPSAIAKLEKIFFRNDLLSKSFLFYGAVWQNILSSPQITSFLENCIVRDNPLAALFLERLFLNIDTQLQTLQDSHPPQLEEIKKNVHSIRQQYQSKLPNIIEKALDKMKKSDSLLEQVDLTTRLIPLLDKERTPSLSAEDLATLLYSWGRVTQHINPKVGLGHYFFAQEHMEKVILPSIPEDKIQDVLNHLLMIEYGGSAQARGLWQKDPLTAYRYFVQSDIPEKEAFSIDYKRGIFKSSTELETSSKNDVIPSITLKDPHYRQVFGHVALEGKVKLEGSSLRYTVQQHGIDYTVDIDASTKKVRMISRSIEGKTLTHQMATVVLDSSSFGAVVKERGLWKDENNQYYLFARSASANPLQDKYTVTLSIDKKGKIKEGQTLDGKHLFIDSTKALDNLFPACKGQNILFFSSEKGGKVDEVVLVDEALSLKREGIDWVPSFKEKGWRVATQSLAGFYKRYGMTADQVILPLENTATREIEYVIFTKRLHVSSVKKAKPKLTVDATSSPQRLSLAVDDRKNLSGSHSAFLYMAMVCYAEGDLAQASSLLQKMSSERALTKAEELPLLLDLERQLETFPAYSDKAAAFLLKASLSLSHIKKEQYRYRDSSLEPSSEDLDRAQRIITLFQRYEKTTSSFEKENALKNENLTLTKNEETELDLFRQHSLLTILGEANKIAGPAEIEIQRPENVDELFFLYLLTMATSQKKSAPLLTQERDISPFLLQNFWEYLSNIQDKKLKAEDLKALLCPFANTQEPGLDAANDMARRFLMTFAKLSEKKAALSLDLPSSKELETLEKILKKTSTPSQKDQDDLQRISNKMKTSLENVVSTAKKMLSNEPLLGRKPSSSEGNIDISDLKAKLLQSPVLSDEEKELYKIALTSLASSDAKKSAPLLEWLQTLHEMKVEIVAKRAMAERDRQIARLETADRPSQPPSFTEVNVKKAFIELVVQDSSEHIRKKFCSESIDSLSQSEITYLKERTPQDLEKLKRDLIKIAQAPSYTEAQKILQSQKDPLQKKFFKAFLTVFSKYYPLKKDSIEGLEKTPPFSLIENMLGLAKDFRSAEEITKTAFLALDQSCKSSSPRMERELERIKKGMEEAEGEASLGIHSVVPLTSIEPLEKTLKEDLRIAQEQCNTLRSEIIMMIRPYAIDLGLFGPFSEPGAYYEEEVITSLLDLYEDGRLESLKGDQPIVEEKITAYLLLSTKKHLLEKSLTDQIGSISHLKSLQADIISSQEATPAQLHLEWNAACRELFKKIDRGYDLKFFCDNNLTLKDQALSRAALVFGYKQKIGVTKEQIDVIKKILQDPNALEELRMGLGKSFVISPLVARLLSKQGDLPVIIFTEELIEQSRKDLDKRAFVFSFKRNPTLSSSRLAEEYQTLLEIKQSGKYVVTTIARLAALENKFHEMQDVLKQKCEVAKSRYHQKENARDAKKQEAEASYKKALEELVEVQNQLSYLQKIYLFFDPTNHGTRFFVDEVDSILNISSEINYAEGLPSKVDPLIYSYCKDIFDRIFTSTNVEVKVLATALRNNKQASMDQEALGKALKALAQEIVAGTPTLQQLGSISDDLASFLSTTSAPRPKDLASWNDEHPTSEQKQIAAIRHFLTKTLPAVCSKQYGIDFGIAENGYTIVPMEGGRAKASTMFGEEAELIGYHLIAYLQDGCKDKDFFSNVLSLIQARADAGEEEWKNFLETLQGSPREEDHQKLFEKLQEKNASGETLRTQFLSFLFLHTYHLEINKKQIPLLVQNIIGTRSFSGASGTMNRDALPESFSKEESQQASRKISGDMLFRLAATNLGLNTKATVFTDPLKQMQDLLKDTSCKAIINIGAPFVGKTTIDVIRDLRKSEHGKQKQFIFIHPTEKTAYFWDTAQTDPTPFDKERDATKIDAKRCVYYFSPADTRGTDFKIPSGYGAVIPGATTTLSEMEQAVWRLRKLGMGQDAKFFIEEGLEKRIRSTTQKQSGDINVADLFVDIIQHTAEAEGNANLKLQMIQPSSITTKHIKDALIRHVGSGNLNSYLVEKSSNQNIFLEKLSSDVEVYSIFKSYFRREQKINLKADYEPSDEIDTLEFLERVYDNEVMKISDLNESLAMIQTPLSRQMRAALALATDEIKIQKNRLQSEKVRLLSALPFKVRSSTSSDEGAQCQIEQQQQTTTLSQKKLKIEDELKEIARKNEEKSEEELALNWAAFMDSQTIQNLKSPRNKTFLGLNQINLMEDISYAAFAPMIKGFNGAFFISNSIKKILSLSPSEKDITPYLVTLPSQASILCTSVEAQSFLKAHSSDPKNYENANVHVLSLSSNTVTPLLPEDASASNENFFLITALSKMIMGINKFNDEETRVLENNFKSQPKKARDDIIARLQKRDSLELSKKMDDWNREVVKDVGEDEENWEEGEIFASAALKNVSENLEGIQNKFLQGTECTYDEIEKLKNWFYQTSDNEASTFIQKMPKETTYSQILDMWNALRTASADRFEIPSSSGALDHTRGRDSSPSALVSDKDTFIDKFSRIETSKIPFLNIIESLTFPLSTFIEELQKAKFTPNEKKEIDEWISTKIDMEKFLKELQNLNVFSIRASYADTKTIVEPMKDYVTGKKSGGMRQFYSDYVYKPQKKVPPQKTKKEPPPPRALPVSEGEKVYISDMVIDKGGMGDCAALSLLDQLQQRAITKLDGSPFSNQQELRSLAKEQLRPFAQTFANEITNYGADAQTFLASENPHAILFKDIIASLQASKDASVLDRNGIQALDAYQQLPTNATADTIAPKAQALINTYAELVGKKGFWLDKGFFTILATHFQKQIVILRPDQDPRLLRIEERFPQNSIDPEQALFIYYNGQRVGRNGYHYQSVNLDRHDEISLLVAIDKKEKIKEFCRSMNDQIQIQKIPQDKRAGFRKYLGDLKSSAPDAYRAFLSLAREKIGLETVETRELSDIQIDRFNTPGFLITSEEIDAKIAALPPTAMAEPSPAPAVGGPPEATTKEESSLLTKWLGWLFKK